MVGYEIVHVALAPLKTMDPDLLMKVANIINRDLYTTRLLLTGKIPKIAAHYQSMHEALSVANKLKTLDLVVIVCNDSDLRKPFSSFKAYSLKPGNYEATFLNISGESKLIKSDDVFLIIRGTIQTTSEKEVTKTKMKLNVPTTLLTGGIPIMRNVKEKSSETTRQIEGFVRIYNRNSVEPLIEIFQFDFDYSFLGDQMALSSSVNLNKLAANLRNTFPQSLYDDTLTSQFDNAEVNSRLIYLLNQAVNGIKP